MPTEIILPRVDMDMASGTIAKWYAKDGDAIEKGALLFDLETSKAAMEIEAPASGNLHRLKAAIGEDIPVGQVLASNYTHYEVHTDVQAPASSNRPAPAIASNGARQAAAPSTDAKADGHSSSHSNGVRATPLARRLARERGIELASLTGLGPNGRIGRADLDQAAAATPRPAPKTSSVATIPVAALAARQHAPHHRQPAGREQGHGTALLPDGGLQPRKAAGRAPGAERSRAKRRTGRLQIVRK